MIRLDKVVVLPGRMRLDVSLADLSPEMTDPELAAKARAVYPTIVSHSCINSSGPTFGDVIARTSIPHLFEHMIIEEQLVDEPLGPGSEFPLVGTTQIAPDRKHATIEISFRDDLIAIHAIARALEQLNALLSEEPDFDEMNY